MKKIFTVFCFFVICTSNAAFATPATDSLLATYKAAGVSKVSAEKGKEHWNRDVIAEDGDTLSCTTCHGKDLTKAGEHHKTHKVIEPMSPRVNAERFTDAKKIEKWFKRNCKDVWGRECTAQEKGDILSFLLNQ